MKKIYALLLSVSLVLIMNQVQAQRTFDSKRKKEIATSLPQNVKKDVPINLNQHPVYSQSRNLNLLASGHKVLFSRNEVPAFITTQRDLTFARAYVRKDTREGCYDYLKELQPLLRFDNTNDFVVQKVSDNARHIRMQQHYKGIPIYGAEVIVHLNEFGQGEKFNGRVVPAGKELNTIPDVSDAAAVQITQAHISRGSAIRPLTAFEKQLIQHVTPSTTLCFFATKSGELKLAYHVVSCPSVHARWEYIIDAHNGKVLQHFNSTCYVDGPKTASANDLNGVSRTINTYQKGSTFYLLDVSRPMFNNAGSTLPDSPAGGILTIDLSNTFGDNQVVSHVTSSNNAWANPKGVSAHFNAGTAYEYYRTNFSRNSIDGNGGTIISIINTPDEDGTGLDNAFWNGKAMFYGNGKVAFKPLAGAIDVAGHEMTHGVVQNSANLEYQGESGAINESMADVFGTMMDPSDWLIGEDVVKPVFTTGALRSLEDPHNGGNDFNDLGYQPAHTNEAFTGADDNGGVHINSGIPNHAFYLYATAITRDKAAKVYYKALTEYLTKSSQFIDLRLAVIAAATDLFGGASNEVTQAGLAFDAVGIAAGPGGDYTNNLPTNPGDEYMLVYNTDTGNSNTIYRLSSDGATQVPLTTTDAISKPSVTDDGSVAVFVAADKTIHVIVSLSSAEPTEFVLDERQIWSNAVISKGGNRLAAVKADPNKSIHIYDFVSEEWSAFELYNPTSADGVTTGGPLYADALEWDYSGEFVVYDCFNRIVNSDGVNLEYWDVNFIHAWDKAAHTFGTGEVQKLFSSLPQGVSIGNPSFSKNSPYILAFDYVDESNSEYYVLGMNVETNDVNILATNNTLGWPSYNKTDTRVAFGFDNSGDNATAYVVTNSDKISSNDNSTSMYANTMWPVYYAAGTRSIGDVSEVTSVENPEKTLAFSAYPNPFVDEVRIKLNSPDSVTSIDMMNSVGQRINNLQVSPESEQVVKVSTHGLPPGQYIIRVRQGRHSGVQKIVKLK